MVKQVDSCLVAMSRRTGKFQRAGGSADRAYQFKIHQSGLKSSMTRPGLLPQSPAQRQTTMMKEKWDPSIPKDACRIRSVDHVSMERSTLPSILHSSSTSPSTSLALTHQPRLLRDQSSPDKGTSANDRYMLLTRVLTPSILPRTDPR